VPSDVLILDANCFKHLEDPGVAARVSRSLRVTRFTLWPTALNALELAKSRNAAVRRRALDAAARFLGDRPLLPLPNDVLRGAGEATARGERSFQFGESGFEWLLLRPEDITPKDITEIEATLHPLEATLGAAFTKGRPEIRAFLNTHGLKAEWASTQEFLDRQWYRRSQLDTLIEGAWTQLGLGGAAPVDALLENEAWRLHLGAFGATLFGRVIANEQMKSVHAWDIAQLVYLSASFRRIFVTEDQAFLHVAQAVLHARHPNARALHWKDFLTLADR